MAKDIITLTLCKETTELQLLIIFSIFFNHEFVCSKSTLLRKKFGTQNIYHLMYASYCLLNFICHSWSHNTNSNLHINGFETQGSRERVGDFHWEYVASYGRNNLVSDTYLRHWASVHIWYTYDMVRINIVQTVLYCNSTTLYCYCNSTD